MISANSKNLKDKIDRILEQNKRYQQQIPLNIVKGCRQNRSHSSQPKSQTNYLSVDNKKYQKNNPSCNQGRQRSGNSWTGDNIGIGESPQNNLRISTTPNSQSCMNKENFFKKNEFLSTKNGSGKGNQKKKIDYNFSLTPTGIQLKNNQASKNKTEKVYSDRQQESQLIAKKANENSKILQISIQNENLLNNSKESTCINDSNYGSNFCINNQEQKSILQSNINISNILCNNRSHQTNLLSNLNQTTLSVQSAACENSKENQKLNQTLNITTNFLKQDESHTTQLQTQSIQNGLNSNKQATNPKIDIVSQLIKIIEKDKKNNAKQFQQFQNQQNQSSIESFIKRQSFSQQMRQVSQQIDMPSTSKRGSNFGLLDSNNNYQHLEEDNSQRVRELKTKYHLRDAILRQEIKKLEQENILLKSSNKQLDEEVNRYRNIRTLENKYIKKLEQELIEEKQKYKINFQKFANNDCSSNSLLNNSACKNNIDNQKIHNIKNENFALGHIQLKNAQITQQNAYQVAKQQEKIISTLSDKVSELMSEKEYLEQILKNLLLKNEMHKQQRTDSLSFEISQQKPSYLNTSFSENSCFNPLKQSTSTTSHLNLQQNNQININTPSQKQNSHNINPQNLQNPPQQFSQINEEFIEESTRNKILQISSQKQNEEQLHSQPYVNINQQLLEQQRENANILNNILEKNKKQELNNNNNSSCLNSRSDTPRLNQKRLSVPRDSAYPPQAPSSQNSVKRYSNRKQNESEKNSARSGVDGFIFGPPKSAHKCSYEEQLMNEQQYNNRVIFLENENFDKEDFQWDVNRDEFIINEMQLRNLIESYKNRAQNQQQVDLL